jgi:hypothetical protein
LALQQSGPIIFDEMGIWCGTLAAFDESVDIIYYALFHTLWWDSTLEAGTWAFATSAGPQFIQHVVKYVVFISIHVRHYLLEVAKNGIGSLNHNLRFR